MYFLRFLENCLDYLNKWTKPTEKLAEFNWVLLDEIPRWTQIDKSCRTLIEKGLFDSQKHQRLFHSFDCLQKYMDDEKIKQFQTKNAKTNKPMPIADRWIEFFTAMDSLSMDCTALAEIVSYALSIPGDLIISLFFILFVHIADFIC